MQIEITGIAERLILAGIASGEFRSAEEMITAMARAWLKSPASCLRELSRFGFQYPQDTDSP